MLQVGQIIQLPMNGQLHSYRVEDISLGPTVPFVNGRQIQLYYITLNNGVTYESDGWSHMLPISEVGSRAAYPIFINGQPVRQVTQ